MKIIDEKEKEEKSWGIKLVEEYSGGYDGGVCLIAADIRTHEYICTIQSFVPDGKIVKTLGVKEKLEESGYDPFEHNNKFDEYGTIIIK
jgi:hypothetical protein